MAVRPTPPALDQHVCFALYTASRAMVRAYGPLLEPLGLTYPQYVVMLALWESPAAVTVGTLGERLCLDSGTLTPLLKRLERAGHIERRRDPTDERRVLVSATPGGRALREAVADIPRCLQERLQLDIPRVLALRDELVALAATIQRATDEPAAR
jgi:DNA-binding MarR family transcriptional regulator